MSQNTKGTVTIIAGPCSVDERNVPQVYTIAELQIQNRNGEMQHAIWGVRLVGLKSRTSMNATGDGMGIDFHEYMYNVKHIMDQKPLSGLKKTRSIEIAQELIEKTGVVIAAEIMEPMSQLPVYERDLPKGKVFVWNPAVNQLGYQVHVMGAFADRNGWFMGVKNGKWLGAPAGDGYTNMEKNWAGHISFATEDKTLNTYPRITLIHRGVDSLDRGDYRYPPVHESAIKVKEKTGAKLFFDPSHIHGDLLRDSIVNATIEAMHMKMKDGSYLYDGVLIEVGDSKTDTGQHITLEELKTVCTEIAKFRDLNIDRTTL